MKFLVALIVWLFTPVSATGYEFTCAQVIWAYETFSEAHIDKMAKIYGATHADRIKAARCRAEHAAKLGKK